MSRRVEWRGTLNLRHPSSPLGTSHNTPPRTPAERRGHRRRWSSWLSEIQSLYSVEWRACVIMYLTHSNAVPRRTLGNVLVHRRLLFVPANSEARSLSDSHPEGRTKHSGTARGASHLRPLALCPFVCNNKLDYKCMRDFQASRRLDITKRTRRCRRGDREFHVNFSGIEIRLPAVFQVGVSEYAGVLVCDAFAFATDFSDVPAARRTYHFLGFLEPPDHLT